MRSIFLILLITLATTATCFGLTVEFKPSASVKQATVTLGDIARFDEETDITTALGSQLVSQAPPPGQEITLRSRDVISHLRATVSLPPNLLWTGSATVTVGRDGLRIGPSRLKEIIADYLNQHRDRLPRAEISFLPDSLPLPFLVPAGNLTWEVIPSSPDILGSSRFSIIFRVNGRVRKNMSIRGRLEALAQVAVTTSPLRKGILIEPEHLALTVQDIAGLKNPCFNPADIIGKKLTRRFRRGEPISLENVEFPPVIKRGEFVKMVVHHGALQLTATGVARTDGRKNQIIRVKNTNSNKIVNCRVAAPGLVEVTL